MTAQEAFDPKKIGENTFPAIDFDMTAELDAWLDRARCEYGMAQFAVRLLKMDDAELLTFVNELGQDAEQRGEAVTDLVEWFGDWVNFHKAAHDVSSAVFARLMIVGSRMLSEDNH